MGRRHRRERTWLKRSIRQLGYIDKVFHGGGDRWTGIHRLRTLLESMIEAVRVKPALETVDHPSVWDGLSQLLKSGKMTMRSSDGSLPDEKQTDNRNAWFVFKGP